MMLNRDGVLFFLLICYSTLYAGAMHDGTNEKSVLLIEKEIDLYNLKPNTSYLIQDVIHLTSEVFLPENITLIFDDNGRLYDNGYLVGKNTKIVNRKVAGPIFSQSGELQGNWNVENISPRWFGAVGDGVKDDTKALQKAVKIGGTVILGEAYSISKPIQITSDVIISGRDNGYTLINFGKADRNQVFVLSEKVDATIEHIETSTGGLLRIASGACNLTLKGNRVVNTTEKVAYGISKVKTTGFFDVDYFEISNNIFENITVAHIDRVIASSLIFNDNTATNCKGYILRSIINDQRVQGYISLQRNRITNLTSGRNGAARVLQASAETTIDFLDNYIENIKAEKSGNFVYWKKGNLNFINNTCINISSNTTGIHDKGVPENYTINIRKNTFDQSEVPFRLGNKPNPTYGIINVNAAHNVNVQDNVYLNLKTFALRISHPFSNEKGRERRPENVLFSNNRIINTDFKSVILVSQVIKNFEISNNCVDGLINSRTKSTPRFVELLVTNPRGKIEDVVISKNSLTNIANNSVLLRTNNNDLACDIITRVSCYNNTQLGGRAFVKILKGGIDHFSITNNEYDNFNTVFVGNESCNSMESASLTANIKLDASQRSLGRSSCGYPEE